MEVTELDGRVSPVPTAPAIVGSNRVAPAPVDLEQGGEPPPAGTDVDAELQLMQQAAGSTTASDQPHSGSMLASKSSIKSAQAAWLGALQLFFCQNPARNAALAACNILFAAC